MSLRHAILALLDVEPGTGYDLMNRFRNSVGFFWQTTHQQVYKELHALMDEALVDCEEQPQSGRPDRKLYRLNAAGGKELDAWLARPAPALKIRDPLLVKVFAGGRLPEAEIRRELLAHRAVHEETLATYRRLEALIGGMAPSIAPRYVYPQQTLRMGIHFEQAWLAWCSEVLDTLQERE
jgi:PadR family transcriptional regulator AphA